jgi:hypothetical protein
MFIREDENINRAQKPAEENDRHIFDDIAKKVQEIKQVLQCEKQPAKENSNVKTELK